MKVDRIRSWTRHDCFGIMNASAYEGGQDIKLDRL